MSALSIREASPEQFESEIWPIFKEVALEADAYPYLPETSMEEARALWFAPHAKVYIAYEREVPVATRYIVPNKPGLGAHVANTGVMIARSRRGQGLGAQMMEFALEETKRLGYRAIQLNLVVETNTASITLCQRYGFAVAGRLPGAFHYRRERYVDAFVMYREL